MTDKSSKLFNPGRFDGALTEAHYVTGFLRAALRKARDRLVRVLRTKHKDDDKAQVLSDKLDACEKHRRCLSGACPECARAAQRLFAETVGKSLEGLADGQQIVCLSLVPMDGICKPNLLSTAQTGRHIRRWKDRLGRAGVDRFIGGLDISFNEHEADLYPPHWSEHVYGVTVTTDIAELKKELRRQFPKSDSIPRPVKVKEWDGRASALDYLLKPNAWRRVGTDDGERFDKKTGTQRSCRATDKQPLRSRQRARLALHLDDLGLQGRLVLRMCQFVNHGSNTAIKKRMSKTVGTKIVKGAKGRLKRPSREL